MARTSCLLTNLINSQSVSSAYCPMHGNGLAWAKPVGGWLNHVMIGPPSHPGWVKYTRPFSRSEDQVTFYDGCPVDRTGSFLACDAEALSSHWDQLPKVLEGQFVAVRLTGNPPQVLDSLASFALTPLAGDALAFMDTLATNLPEKDGIPRWSRRKARGLLHAVAAFDCYQRQEYRDIVTRALSALALDLSWLRNRGLLIIAGRSLVKHLVR